MILGLKLDRLGQGAELAEQAGLDFVFLDNSTAAGADIGADPLSVAAFLMTKTRGVGLAASVPDSWPPYNVARALASFDLLSGGRCGWLPWSGAGEAANPQRSAEHLDVVLQLFDSWDDDALVFDKAASVFADRNKVRRICHSGAYFTVDGPLNAPRPPQGRPVLFQRSGQLTAMADVELIDLDEDAPRSDCPTLRLAEVVVDPNADPSAALADRLADAFAERCDGFLLAPADPGDLPRLLDDLVPRLKALGAPGPSQATGDFRTRLGLPRPANRFVGQAIVATPSLS
jgi:alkanesulfonate monooxygenase SsuD/methylene tetrahydromethanopterin reductase-like flavin-dependent oxidoreductase (luciferase family)